MSKEQRAAQEQAGLPVWASRAPQYGPKDYLAQEDFVKATDEVRTCWEKTGMLHLRMRNDINQRARNKTPIPEIMQRIDEVEEHLRAVRALCENKE